MLYPIVELREKDIEHVGKDALDMHREEHHKSDEFDDTHYSGSKWTMSKTDDARRKIDEEKNALE